MKINEDKSPLPSPSLSIRAICVIRGSIPIL
jgi:hypothetical protein